jgi:hypothetical protein
MDATTIDTVENILQSAKKLDSIERLSVARALLRDIQEQLRKEIKLPLLSGLNEQELDVLAWTLSPSRNQRLKYLLKKIREGELNEKQSNELDTLLVESDKSALLKAKAQYTLKKYHIFK